jgi:hypothetical protein
MTNRGSKEGEKANFAQFAQGPILSTAWLRQIRFGILHSLLAVGLFFLSGCASNRSAPPRAAEGVREYGQLVTDSSAAVQQAVSQLDKLLSQQNGFSPKSVSDFCDEVQRLQLESMRVRARVQAIQDRGDAYFDAWFSKEDRPENLGDMHAAFTRIKLASLQTREAFQAFLRNLRTLRARFESAPNAYASQEILDRIRLTRTQGLQVEQSLGYVNAELASLSRLLPRS